jgi:hypothetical protein
MIVHARRLDVAQHDPDPGIGEDRAECGGEVRAAVADHELDPVRLLAEVHDQVAGLLGGPFSGGMQRDPENPDVPAGVLDHGQDVSLGAIEKVGREEVARQDRLGLGAQEQRPGWPAPAGLASHGPGGPAVWTMSRCQRRTVSGVTSRCSPWRRTCPLPGGDRCARREQIEATRLDAASGP